MLIEGDTIMKELKCPKCGTAFKIDEQDYESIVKQIRDHEFENELARREKEFQKEKASAVKIAEQELTSKYKDELNTKDTEIANLKSEIKTKELETESKVYKKYNEILKSKELEINNLTNKLELSSKDQQLALKDAISEKQNEIDSLNNQITSDKNEYLLKEQSLKETYEEKIKSKDEQIAYYKDFKARQSTKMIGESLEQHCNNEFNKLRSLFGNNVLFEKDNDAKSGSKGDFIYRETTEEGIEVLSIMFEMKNEADETATKHKNEDFLKELNKDRLEKNCEYAVLVSLLEADNDYYNNGIVDMSHKYPKMYVIRPQFFIPLITLLRNASLNTLAYKRELEIIKNQNIDISHFEDNINAFKEGFSRNYRLASDKFAKAIEEIDKTMNNLKKVKEDLISSENNLRLANKKADELTIKKLTHNNPTMINMFAELKSEQEEVKEVA